MRVKKVYKSSYASYLRAKNSLADAKNNILGLQNKQSKNKLLLTQLKTTSYSNEEEQKPV